MEIRRGSQKGINRDFGPRTYRNNKLTRHPVTLGEKLFTLLKSLSGIPISNKKTSHHSAGQFNDVFFLQLPYFKPG